MQSWSITIARRSNIFDRENLRSRKVQKSLMYGHLTILPIYRFLFLFRFVLTFSNNTGANEHNLIWEMPIYMQGLSFNSLRRLFANIHLFILFCRSMPLLLSLCECTRVFNYMLIHSDAALHAGNWVDVLFLLSRRCNICHSCCLSITFLFIYWFFLLFAGNVAALCILLPCCSSHKSLFNWKIQNTKHNHLSLFCSYALYSFFAS